MGGERKVQIKINLLRWLILTTCLGTIDPVLAEENTTLTLSSPTVRDMEALPLKYSQTGTRPSIVVAPG